MSAPRRFSLLRWVVGSVGGAFAGLVVPAMIAAFGPDRTVGSVAHAPLPVDSLISAVATLTGLSCLQSLGFRGRPRLRDWTMASALGWALGILIVTRTGLGPSHPAWLSAVTAGFELGLPVGLAQFLVLRGHVARPQGWAIMRLLLGTARRQDVAPPAP
jgi:hypothetical protein